MTNETAAMRNDGKTSKELIDELYDPQTGLPISYVLARVRREPMLFQGDDFVHTDVRSALREG
jgi:uncharacterized protein with PIN domain